MPLDQVQRGMQCEGRSVFRGTAIETFNVEILDVLEKDPQGSSPVILFRAYGPAVDDTGLGFGFSGSPIYCPDSDGVMRNAGAVYAGVEDYGNDTALATPIEAVLSMPVEAPPQARTATRAERSAEPWAGPLCRLGSRARAFARRSGPRPPAKRLPLINAPATSSQVTTGTDLVPGSADRASVSSGAVGLERDRHGGLSRRCRPDLGVRAPARRRRPALARSCRAPSFTRSSPTRIRRASTSAPTSWPRPATPPARSTSTATSRSAARWAPRPRRSRWWSARAARPGDPLPDSTTLVADESPLDHPSGLAALSLVTSIAVSDSVFTALGSSGGRSYGDSACASTSASASQPMRFCNRYIGDAGFLGGTEIAMGGDAATAATLVERFDRRQLHVDRVRATLDVHEGARLAHLRGASGPRRRSAPGERIRVRIRYQRPREPVESSTFSVRVPRSLEPGRRMLRLTGSGADPGDASLDAVFAAGMSPDEVCFGEEGGRSRRRPSKASPPRSRASTATTGSAGRSASGAGSDDEFEEFTDLFGLGDGESAGQADVPPRRAADRRLGEGCRSESSR